MSQSTPLPPDRDAFAADSSSEATLSLHVELPPPITASPPYPSPPQPDEDLFATTREWLMKLVEEVERIDPDLPADLAENHRKYRMMRRGND
ncbi:MAG: hypothetical protein WD875_02390 [Pirellulales bacterium]